VDVTDTSIEIPGMRLAARWWGPRELAVGQTPVLALHGWLDNAATFDGLAPQLSPRPFVALDLPGHGESDHLPAVSSYLFIEYVAAVHAVLEALGWKSVTLLGHSLGAGVAATYAGTFPDTVSRLVLIEGLGPMSDPEEAAPVRLARALVAQAKHHRKADRPPIYPDVDAVVARLQAVQSSMSPASARTLLGRGLAPLEDGVTWRSDRRLRHPSRLRLTERQVMAFLEAITAPTLLVRAKDGLPFAREIAEPRASAVDELTIVEVEGGHHVHLDAPERVAPVIGEFLDR
jgi:pimeloyl-ACP methyl ester carboxylesterase